MTDDHAPSILKRELEDDDKVHIIKKKTHANGCT